MALFVNRTLAKMVECSTFLSVEPTGDDGFLKYFNIHDNQVKKKFKGIMEYYKNIFKTNIILFNSN